MKIARILYEGAERYAAFENAGYTLLDGTPFAAENIDESRGGGERIGEGQAVLLPPCVPSKIVCAGLNYVGHAKEMAMELPKVPVIFLKPPSSAAAHNQDVIYPTQCGKLDYECELAVVIKKTCKNISASEAGEYILGATCLNDVTARDLQALDGQWTRAKGFDTFCPFGPYIDTEFNYAKGSDICTRVNGEVRQKGNTADLIFDAKQLVAFISSVMTLEPGDVISTGTPKGIGSLEVGDVMEVEIEGLGVLKNAVRAV